MQTNFMLSFLDIPVSKQGQLNKTTAEEWGRMTYEQKCKDSTYIGVNPRYISENVRRSIFSRLFNKHGGKCYWCNIDVTITKSIRGVKEPHAQGTIDHLKTMRMGRKNFYEGGHVLACKDCNNKRNNVENKLGKLSDTIRLIF